MHCAAYIHVIPVVPGLLWHPQILADQLTLSEPSGADYAHHMTTGIPGFSDPPTSLAYIHVMSLFLGKSP